MQSRKLLIDQFSNFIRLGDDRFEGWCPEPRLHKSMAHQLQQSSAEADSEAQFWALYWHQHWRDQSHIWAEQHLLAYLQEACYWVAQEIFRKVTGVRSQSATGDSPVDFFQMAMADVPLALGKFKPQKSSYLKSFAQVFLSNRIKSSLRQRRQADFCSIWGLLRKTSRKQLFAVLQQQGMGEVQVAQYRLLWMGFQALYVPNQPTSSQLPKPDQVLWQDIADFYNDQRLTLLEASAPRLEAAGVAEQLRSLSQWIRNYHYPKVDSLNRPRFPGEDSGPAEDWQDAIASEDSGASLQALISQEEQAERRQTQAKLHQQLAQAFEQLDEQSQLILNLLYREGLSQQTVMVQVQVSQPTISRRVKKAKKQLLEQLLQWVQANAEQETQESINAGVNLNVADPPEMNLNNFPNPDQLKAITVALEEWLRVYLHQATELSGDDDGAGDWG